MSRFLVLPRRSIAFTLIELLVVISIIAVLIAMLIPSLTKARNQAMTLRCAANMHNLGIGLAAYSSDFRQSIPLFYGSWGSPGPYPGQLWRAWITDWVTEPTSGNWREISSTREWFLFYGEYVAPRIGPTLGDERKLWELGRQVGVFDCPSTTGVTNYGYMATVPKTFDYRRTKVWKSYDANGLPTSAEATRVDEMPSRAMVLIDSSSKYGGGNTGNDILDGSEHPQYALFGGPSASWYYLNTAEPNLTSYSIAPYYGPVAWMSTLLDVTMWTNQAGTHHDTGAVVLTADASAGRQPVTNYYPNFNVPNSSFMSTFNYVMP